MSATEPSPIVTATVARVGWSAEATLKFSSFSVLSGVPDSQRTTLAARRREEVREQAAQLADWEVPPSIAPEGLSTAEVRLLLADAERILGCVLAAAAAAAPAAASSPDEATADDGAGVALRAALGEAQAHLGEAQEYGRQMAEKEAAAQREVGKLQEQVVQLQAQLSAQVGAPSG